MSPEMIAILAVGVALAGLMLRGQHGLSRRVDELRGDLDKRVGELRGDLDKRVGELRGDLEKRVGELRGDLDKRMGELRGDIAGLDARLRSVETGLAEVKGQLTMVRDYITGRNLREPEPGADE